MKKQIIAKLLGTSILSLMLMGFLFASPFANVSAEENEEEPEVTEPSEQPAVTETADSVKEEGTDSVSGDVSVSVSTDIAFWDELISTYDANPAPVYGEDFGNEEPVVPQESAADPEITETDGNALRAPAAAAAINNPEVIESDAKAASLSATTASVTNEEPSIITPSEDEISDDVIYIDGTAYIRSFNDYYGDLPVYYHYTDDFFADRSEVNADGQLVENAFIYDPSLSSMSAELMITAAVSHFARSGEGEEAIITKSRNAQEMLRQLGFEDIDINSAYVTETTIDGVMLIAGNKKVVYDGKEYTLIVLLPDTGTTGGEMSLNVEIGDGEFHDGFHYAASEVVLPFLSDYISDNGISGDIKLWTAGASRAAGITNTTGGLLDLAIDQDALYEILPDSVSLEKKNLYVYTFGTPGTVTKDITWIKEDGEYVERRHDFDNIHNLRNHFDVLTLLFGDEWDIDIFGEDYLISFTEEGFIPEEKMDEMIQELCRQWTLMSGTAPEDLVLDEDYMWYDPETGKFVYYCEDYSSPVTGDDLETLTNRLSKELAPLLTREHVTAYLQPLLTFGTGTALQDVSHLTDTLKEEADRFAEEAKDTVKKLILKGILTFDFSELRSYLTNDLNPLNALPQILINTYKTLGIEYNYDFAAHEFTDELLDDAVMREVIRQDVFKLGPGAADLLSRAGLKDVLAAIDFYQLLSDGFKTISAGHNTDLYAAWARTLDPETEVYQLAMSEEDAWGYRMVNLPEEGSYTVYVYDTSSNEEGYLLRFRMRDGEVQYGGRTADADWTVHIGTGDKGEGKVLYLRPNHSYDLVFVPDETDTLDLSVDEFSYQYYRAIFRPVNHVTMDTGTGTSFAGIVLSQVEGQRQDHLVLHIGALESYPTGPDNSEPVNRKLLAASIQEPGSALAEYTIEKAIQMLAVSGIDSSILKWVEYQLSGDDTAEFSVTASEQEGYAFDGWYFGDELIGSNLIYSAWLTFKDFGKTIIAKYHALPKPAPSPSSGGSSGSSTSVSAASSVSYASYVTAAENTASGNYVRVNRSPNTADDGFAGWITLFFLSVISMFVSAFLLKQEYC